MLTGFLAMTALFMSATPVLAVCRHGLALGLDVSSSVDRTEYEEQMNGLAEAFLDQDVQAVLLASSQTPVAVAVYEWGGSADQKLLLDWHLIETKHDILLLASVFQSKSVYTRTSLTAMGRAITYGANLLAAAPDCWQLTLDISADGKSNEGYGPVLAKSHPVYDLATINGLVVASENGASRDQTHAKISEMVSYFKSDVIHGPGSFVQVAKGYSDYSRAMRKKLLRELTISVSGVTTTRRAKGG